MNFMINSLNCLMKKTEKISKKISIIIPVYNVETYLQDCLNSIISQTYPHLEILLIDDGSTDSSGKICDQFARVDDRIRVFHIKNAGVSNARNVGIENSTGDYISFIDSDDIIHSDFYNIQIKYLLQSSADTISVLIEKVPENFKISDINDSFISLENKYLTNLEVLDCVQNPDFLWVGYPVNKLYSAKIIKDNNIRFDVNLKFCEESVFNCRYFEKSKSVVLNLSRLYFYRIRKTSATNSLKQSEKLKSMQTILSLSQKYHGSVFYYRISAANIICIF